MSHEGQNFHDFITELKNLSSECKFEFFDDSLIKNRIVCGTNDNSLTEHYLHDSPKVIFAGHAAKEIFNFPENQTIGQARPLICTRFQNIQYTEVKHPFKLQT